MNRKTNSDIIFIHKRGVVVETVLNFKNAKKIVSNGGDSSARGRALFKIIFGIMREWDLTQSELATLVGRQPTTISDWKKKEFISTSKAPDMNDIQLFEFIELYKALTNFFVLTKDRVAWLREANDGMNKKAPLDLIKEDPRNLLYVRNILSHLSNP